MNKQEILEKISNHIEQMIVQFETICTHSDKIPTSEMDRMLNEIRATYELFTVLNYINTAVGENKNPLLEKIQQTKQMMASLATKPEPTIEAAPAEEPQTIAPQTQVVVEEKTVTVEEKEVAPIEYISPKIEESIVPPTPEIVVKHEEKQEIIIPAENIAIEKTESETVITTSAQTETTFNKKINTDSAPKGIHNKALDEEDGYIIDKISVKIADLKKNVALHEKFLYINELFGGNNNAYNEMIDAIEANPSVEEASKIVAQCAEKFNWNAESKTFKQLRLLIQRRF